MLILAVILKFLVASKCFGTEDAIFTKPFASEISLFIDGLVLGQLDLGRGGVRGQGKNSILIQQRAIVTTVEVSIMLVQIISKAMAKTKVLPDGRVDIKSNASTWLGWAEDSADHRLWFG